MGKRKVQRIKIQGTINSVEKATKHIIDKLRIDKIEVMQVESRFIPPVMGKSGSNVQQIKAKTGANIAVDMQQKGINKIQEIFLQGFEKSISEAIIIIKR